MTVSDLVLVRFCIYYRRSNSRSYHGSGNDADTSNMLTNNPMYGDANRKTSGMPTSSENVLYEHAEVTRQETKDSENPLYVSADPLYETASF